MDVSELESALSAAGAGVDRARLEQVVGETDDTGSGEISFPQFCR